MSRFTGRVAIVTGAAGGIGLAACARFASEGASVVAVDLASANLAAAVAAIEDAGGTPLAVPADVTSSAQVAGYVDAAREAFGRVDVLFNNAGIEGTYAPMIEYSEESFDQVIAVNVRGVWLGIKYAAPAMIAISATANPTKSLRWWRSWLPTKPATSPAASTPSTAASPPAAESRWWAGLDKIQSRYLVPGYAV